MVMGLVQGEGSVVDRDVQVHRRDARGRRTAGTGGVAEGDRDREGIGGLAACRAS